MFAEAIEEILRDQCTPAHVRALTHNPGSSELWDSIAGAGFLDVMRAEDRNGAGLGLPAMHELVQLFGYYAAPLPLAESIGARALVEAQVDLPNGMIALAPNLIKNEGTWTCPRVPFGALAEYVLSQHGQGLVLLPCNQAVREQPDLPGGTMVTLSWSRAEQAAVSVEGNAVNLLPVAALMMSGQIAGAMQRVMEMTLEYCNTRSQFGRNLGKFQAVQHQLSVMAEHALATAMAVAAAFRSGERTPTLVAVAMAKARASEAAVLIANTAHALHGAIGITEEYDLQLYTHRLHEGRLAYGAEPYWQRLIGQDFFAQSDFAADYARRALG